MIASGENFTIALKSDGSVWAWGDNTYGQLGNGNFESSQGPIPVLAVDATKNLVVYLRLQQENIMHLL